MCCVTKKYVESKSCIREITYADINEIKMEILMFERLLTDSLGEVGFIIGPLVRHNAYKSSDLLNNWSGDLFDGILKAIKGSIAKATEIKNQSDNHLPLIANNRPQIPVQFLTDIQPNVLNKKPLDPVPLAVTNTIPIPEPRVLHSQTVVLRNMPVQIHCQNCDKTVLSYTIFKNGSHNVLMCLGLAFCFG